MLYIQKTHTKTLDRLQICCISGIKLPKGRSLPINFSIPYAGRSQDFIWLARCSLKRRVIKNKHLYLRSHSGIMFCSILKPNPPCMLIPYTCLYSPLRGLVLWHSCLLPYYFLLPVMNTYLYSGIKNKEPSLKKSHLHHTDALCVLTSEDAKIQEGLFFSTTVPMNFNCIYQRKLIFHSSRRTVNTLRFQGIFTYW